MKNEPISLYVPARNAESTLIACIDAIRAQTRQPDQLFILADPRSSDRTMEVARSCGVEVIEQRGRSLGSTRNEAIIAAHHPWLACCDSDVIIERDWLAKLAARRDQKAAGIGGRTIERVRNPFDQWRALHMPHHWGDYPLRNPFMLVSEVLFNRQALLTIGGYRDDLNYNEDSDLCQRLRDAGYDLFYEPSAIGVHQRTDTLSGLITLRWKYSEHRQSHLMDRFAGLIQKIAINREYALNTLSRSLARGCEELAYISFFLFFHHLQMDLRSLLARRPLIAPMTPAFFEQALLQVIGKALGEHHPGLARWITGDLQSDQPNIEDEPLLPPVWTSYLDAVRQSINNYCHELSPRILSLIDSSARSIHGQGSEETVSSLHLWDRHLAGQTGRMPVPQDCTIESLQAELDALPIRPFIDESFCRRLAARWPETKSLSVLGRIDAREEAIIRGVFPNDSPYATDTIGLIAHLEANANPLKLLSLESNMHRLVVCYQPPPGFIAGLDVPSASDLASSAAAAGWTIEHFDTLVGRIQLILSRRTPSAHHTLETTIASR